MKKLCGDASTLLEVLVFQVKESIGVGFPMYSIKILIFSEAFVQNIITQNYSRWYLPYPDYAAITFLLSKCHQNDRTFGIQAGHVGASLWARVLLESFCCLFFFFFCDCGIYFELLQYLQPNMVSWCIITNWSVIICKELRMLSSDSQLQRRFDSSVNVCVLNLAS